MSEPAEKFAGPPLINGAHRSRHICECKYNVTQLFLGLLHGGPGIRERDDMYQRIRMIVLQHQD